MKLKTLTFTARLITHILRRLSVSNEGKVDSNLRYGTVLICIKGATLPSIKGANRQYRSNKNLDFVIVQDDYCCNSMVGLEDSNPKGVNTPPSLHFVYIL